MTHETEFKNKCRDLRELCRMCDGKDKASEAQALALAIKNNYSKYHSAIGRPHWGDGRWELYYGNALAVCETCEGTSKKKQMKKSGFASTFREYFALY